MNSLRRHLGPLALALGLSVVTAVLANDPPKKGNAAAAATGKLIKITDAERAWAAKARETYPLKVCVTSDEKLGSMGDNAEYVYREKGKPDRLVILCCDGCEEDFAKEPAKHLAKIDAAAKAAKK